MQPEAKLVKKIQDLYRKHGALLLKIHGGDNPFQAVGIPDLIICFRGRFVGMEVKMPSGELRAAQRVKLREIFDAHGVAAVVETVGQASVLLSYLEKEGSFEASQSLCYDRGAFRRDRCQFK